MLHGAASQENRKQREPQRTQRTRRNPSKSFHSVFSVFSVAPHLHPNNVVFSGFTRSINRGPSWRALLTSPDTGYASIASSEYGDRRSSSSSAGMSPCFSH